MEKKSKEEIEELNQEFNKLKTIEQKLDFWERKLNTKYINNYIFFRESKEFDCFKIVPQNHEEIELLNRKCLQLTIESKRNSLNQPIESELLIQDYQEEIFDVKNKEHYREKTLEWIKDIIKEKEKQKASFPKMRKRYEYFFYAYENYLYKKIEPDFSEKVLEFDFAYEINNGYELSKFHDYVINGKLAKSKKITHDFQMLLLDYLGVGNEIDNSTKRAKLYSHIIDRAQEPTRQKLSKLSEAKSLDNLKYLKSLFQELNLIEQLQLVEKDLNRLLKK